MLVAIPLFPRFTALDAVGPYEVLQRIPSIDVVFVGHPRGEVRTENGMLGVTCDATFDEIGADDHRHVPRSGDARLGQGRHVDQKLRQRHRGHHVHLVHLGDGGHLHARVLNYAVDHCRVVADDMR
jgi:hypothetical protein